MFSRIKAHKVRSSADIEAFYDRLVAGGPNQTQSLQHQLPYRLNIIRRHANLREDSVILEVGCGDGQHLLGLMGENRRGFGVDISSLAVKEACKRVRRSSFQDRVIFRKENAEELSSISKESVDLAFCVGSFEHILDKKRVLGRVCRVLKPHSRFICLTHNGGSLWNRWIAPHLGIATTHLSTDKYLNREEIDQMVRESGYESVDVGFWSFVPKGDVYFPFGIVLGMMDVLGQIFGRGLLREGLFFVAQKG